ATNDWWWGGGIGWGNRNIYWRNNWHNNNRQVWRHNSVHRHGVRYANRDLARRYNRAGDVTRRNVDGVRRHSGRARANENRNRNAANCASNKRTAENRSSNRKAVQNRSSGRHSAQRARSAKNRSVHRASSQRARSANRGGRRYGNVGHARAFAGN